MVFCFKVVVVGLDLCCEGFEAAAFLILDEEPDCEGFVERLFAPLEAPDLILVVIAPVVHCFLLSSQKVFEHQGLIVKACQKSSRRRHKVSPSSVLHAAPPSSFKRQPVKGSSQPAQSRRHSTLPPQEERQVGY